MQPHPEGVTETEKTRDESHPTPSAYKDASHLHVSAHDIDSMCLSSRKMKGHPTDRRCSTNTTTNYGKHSISQCSHTANKSAPHKMYVHSHHRSPWHAAHTMHRASNNATSVNTLQANKYRLHAQVYLNVFTCLHMHTYRDIPQR